MLENLKKNPLKKMSHYVNELNMKCEFWVFVSIPIATWIIFYGLPKTVETLDFNKLI